MKKIVFALLFALIFYVSLFAENGSSVSSTKKPVGESPGASPSAMASSDSLLFTGSFIYSIPLDVPPGIQGLQPQLTLSYNSSSSNGWCGVGWDLSFGIIQRSTKNGIPTYENNNDGSSKDTFVFSSGGSTQELAPIDTNEYRIKIDSSFMKFTFSATDNEWTAYDKSGTRYIFGHGWGESATVVKPNTTDVFSWSLSSIIDANNNEIYFFYTHDQNQIYPSWIQYNHHGNESPPMREIVFELEDREDRFVNCRPGFSIKLAKRLKTITTSVNDKVVLIYKVDYIASNTGKSALSSLSKTDVNGSYFPTYTFKYNDLIKAFGDEQNWNASGDNCDLRHIYTFTEIYKQGGGFSSYSHQEVDFQDINGDGLPDHIGKHRSEDFVKVRLNKNGYFEENQNWPAPSLNNGNNEDLRFSTRSLSGGGSTDPDLIWAWTDFIDINGDGLPDRVNHSNFKTSYSLNSGASFQPPLSWGFVFNPLAIGMAISDNYLRYDSDYLDVNGDGLPDNVRKSGGENNFYIWLANANGLGTGTTWPTPNWTGPGHDYLRWTDIETAGIHSHAHGIIDFIDINGDGLPDQICKSRDENFFRVRLNLGGSFSEEQSWPSPTWNGIGDLRQVYTSDGLTHTEKDFVDINGDGLPDQVGKHRSEEFFRVMLNMGDHFTGEQIWNTTPWKGLGNADLRYVYGDTAIDDGDPDYKHIYTHDSNEVDFVDINGDGLPDQVGKHRDENFFRVRLNQSSGADLLKEIINPMGGITQITYAPSRDYPTTKKLPYCIYVVKTVTTNNNINSIVQKTHEYKDGFYDSLSKEFLGFGEIKVIDAEGNYTITKFHQNLGQVSETDGQGNITYVNPYKGKIASQESYDSGAHPLAKTENMYDCVKPITGQNWYFPRLRQTDGYTYNGGVEKHTWAMFHYDSYGNVTEADNFGDYSTNTDDVINLTEYAYNTDAYLVGYPVHQITRDYNSVTKAEGWIYYDDAVTPNTAPVKGNVTKKAQWQQGGNDPIVTMEYDRYGNVTKVKDANYNADNSKGNIITTTYDTVYHTFPVEVANILVYTQKSTYDPGTGNVLTETDANYQTARYEYDNFGRLFKVFSPIDNIDSPSTIYTYNDTTLPRSVHIQSKEEGQATGDTATTAKYLDTWQFYDGLGRIAQTQSQNTTKWSYHVISDVKTYNSRGLVDKSYTPFLPDHQTYPGWVAGQFYENIPTVPYFASTRYTYDALGRVIRQDLSDGTYSTVSFSGWTQTTTDPRGKATTSEKDSFGRIRYINETIGGQTKTTSYNYDTLGNLTSITNAINETTTINYDTLGRKINMNDPKMGHWDYTYDANGNLISQKDAKGQTTNQLTTLIYDRLNRIVSKVYPPGGGQIDYAYDTGNYGKGRLAKVTDLSGATEFTYDKIGRVTSTKKSITKGNNSKEYTTSSQYNASGQQTKLTYPNSKEISYGYNTSGDLLTVGDTVTDFVKQTEYNQNKQIITMDFNNGLTTAYEYNYNNLRLTKLITGNTSNFTFTDPTYISYDKKDHTAFREFLESLEVSK